MKRRLFKPDAVGHIPAPGKRRAARLRTQTEARRTWAQRLMARLRTEREDPKRFNPTGLKRQYVMGLESAKVSTPYFAKERKRRRAARRVAHESRRRNFQYGR